MANALQFIESNIEDLDKAEVQAEIVKKFEEFLNGDEVKLKYPNLALLLTIYQDAKEFSIQELQLISELLFKADDLLKSSINSNLERFKVTVKDNSRRRGFKWDDLALFYEWSFEADRIREYIKLNKTPLRQVHLEAISEAMKT
jgi:hypothetical protein